MTTVYECNTRLPEYISFVSSLCLTCLLRALLQKFAFLLGFVVSRAQWQSRERERETERQWQLKFLHISSYLHIARQAAHRQSTHSDTGCFSNPSPLFVRLRSLSSDWHSTCRLRILSSLSLVCPNKSAYLSINWPYTPWRQVTSQLAALLKRTWSSFW